MIYLVSNSIVLDESVKDIEKISLTEALKLIRTWPVVQFDGETTGLDPHICKLRSHQFGYKDFNTGECTQIIIDCRDYSPLEYKDILESSYLIGHNLKFDIEYLYNYKIVPTRIYDTMIAEQVLYMGYKSKQIHHNLGSVVQRYLNIEIDKSFQKEIATKGLTLEGIRYSANDVVYLQDIRKAQIQIAKSRKCEKAIQLENNFVTAIAYLEWCGIKLDVKKWEAKIKSNLDKKTSALDWLNNYVLSHSKLSKKFATEYEISDLFSGPDSFSKQCTVQWSSAQQVTPIFKELGFNVTTLDKKSHEEKESVMEDVLKSQRGIADDFLDTYFEYKKAEKDLSAFGQGHINAINPYTGRIHTQFKQIGTITGRMSSGSDSKNNDDLARAKGLPVNPSQHERKIGLGCPYPNMQQLPHDEYTRSCFIAESGNVFVSCDYSAEESRVQGCVWKEEEILKCFREGIDTHNMYAKMFFPEELKDCEVTDVKKKYPDLRQRAKAAEFAVGYGSSGYSIAAKLGVPLEEAKTKVSALQSKMKGMASFKKKASKFLRENGYLIINDITGHRVYWPEWNTWRQEDLSHTQDFWDEYNNFHKGTGDSVCKRYQKFKAQGADWLERKVLNVPIQGGSAIVLKKAATDLFRWVVNNNYFGTILFCVFAHDEIDCECPKELENVFPQVMQSIMKKAAATFYKELPIPAEASCGSYWIH